LNLTLQRLKSQIEELRDSIKYSYPPNPDSQIREVTQIQEIVAAIKELNVKSDSQRKQLKDEIARIEATFLQNPHREHIKNEEKNTSPQEITYGTVVTQNTHKPKTTYQVKSRGLKLYYEKEDTNLLNPTLSNDIMPPWNKREKKKYKDSRSRDRNHKMRETQFDDKNLYYSHFGNRNYKINYYKKPNTSEGINYNQATKDNVSTHKMELEPDIDKKGRLAREQLPTH